jgi:hypothetical protein
MTRAIHRLFQMTSLLVLVLWSAPAETGSMFCNEMCTYQEQDCGTLCNLGGGVSACGAEGFPCCTSESGFNQIGARWEGFGWCNEVMIGNWVSCRNCPSSGNQCSYGGCTETGGGWAFGYSNCGSLNWGQQSC